MKPICVTDDIYRLSLNVEDILFEQLWDIPQGVTLNSYLVRGEKTALIDGVCGWDGIPEKLFNLLDQMDVKLEDLDYIIINHMEPDHSGWINDLKTLKKDVKIYCTHLGAGLLKNFFGIVEGVHIIKNGEILDLGNGKELEFIQQPNIHWPDTMMTLERSSQTLFTCDMFGSFGVCNDNHFDDTFSDEDIAFFWEEQIRYYSNVLVTFNKAAQKAIDKTMLLNPSIIAPGHGPVYRKNPSMLIEQYEKISHFVEGEALDEVTVLWGSMYGMTEKAVQYIDKILERENIKYHRLQLPQSNIGEIVSKCMRSKAVIIAAPTYENNLFPPAASALDELGRKKINHKSALYIGSYGWSGGGNKEVNAIIEHYDMQWQLEEPVVFQGEASDEKMMQVEKSVMDLIKKMS